MARIKEQSIEKVRLVADIIETISKYVDLKQRGRNHFGLCPFHNEKTPSFSVNPDKQIYKCFGCGAGGGTINFIMEIESLDFPDAVKYLAQLFNVIIEVDEDPKYKKRSDLKSQLIEIHNIATKFYQNNLLSNKGEKALSYLKKRGLSNSIIKEFKLGFSLDSFDDLLKLVRQKSFSAEAMKASGLFIKSEKGYFNRFRSRIMFPIQDYKGNTIAFGGRIFDKDDPAKYQNSPETPIYYKSNVLYGTFQNSKNIKPSKKIILVEGYMDLLQLTNAGINNCLAISGTAFTNGHAILLKRYNTNINIVFDGDEAGKNAALKCGYMLIANSILPKIITPPDDLDPDDWIIQDGVEGFNKGIEQAQSVIESHYHNFINSYNDSNYNINEMIYKALDNLSIVKDLIIQEMMIKELSEITSINQQNIMNALNERINKKKNYQKNEAKEVGQNISNQVIPSNLYNDLIRLCFSEDINIRNFIFHNFDIHWLQDNDYKIIYDNIYIHLNGENTPIPEIISEQIDDKKIRQKLIDLVFDLDNFEPNKNMVIDCLQRIEKIFIKTKIELVRNKLKESENMSILKELSILEKAFADIKLKYAD